MISPRLKLEPTATELVAGFTRIRDLMHVPTAFPAQVVEESLLAVGRGPMDGPPRTSRLDLDFITIDPPGSMDLDQAFCGARESDGYRIHYAIADLGHFVEPGGHLDAESGIRGKTLYFPDEPVPLYPRVLSEGAASLLPGDPRPAVLWSFDLDSSANVRSVRVERAVISSRRRLTYAEAQGELDSESPVESLHALRQVGELRQALEQQRGGVDLRLPDQQVEKTPDGFHLEFREELPVERWNAQISIMTGMAAAGLMVAAGIGVTRVLPAPPEEMVARLRTRALALGLGWPQTQSYQQVIRSLDPSKPKEAALLSAATVLLRGAGYAFFNGEPPGDVLHHAIAAPYAHVTAPLRRMADRLANELVLSLVDGAPAPQWLLDRMSEAPEIMKQADQRSHDLDSRIIDYVEAEILQNRIGEEFDAVVVDVRRDRALVQLSEPAVLARCTGGEFVLGDRIKVKLATAQPEEGRVVFEPVL